MTKLITLILLALLSILHAQLVAGHARDITSPPGDTGAADATRKPLATIKAQAVPWDQIGAKATAEYHGDGQAVIAEGTGARLHCVFQRLEGEATPEGLWLSSTVTNQPADRFQVKAVAVGRAGSRAMRVATGYDCLAAESELPLAPMGTVSIAGQVVRYARAGLVEEYTVSMDGVRQDLVVTTKPRGVGELQVRLAVTGARVEAPAYGARLVLDRSGRKIAYSRVRATDATGKELMARIKVVGRGESQRDSIVQPRVASPRATLGSGAERAANPEGVASDPLAGQDGSGDATPLGLEILSRGEPRVGAGRANPGLHDTIPSGLNASSADLGVTTEAEASAATLVAIVNDAAAVYPVRIDPTFSDANWISMSGIAGTDGDVNALLIDGSGNLYVGGGFTVAGNVIANNIAKWDGTNWSALGSGLNGGAVVYALAVSGTNLFAGGEFTTAGGVAATNIARWDGSSWSALGQGIGAPSGTPYYGGRVSALAVSGNTLYAGGHFTMAGGVPANNIAQWNGSSWSVLGSGVGDTNSSVSALAVSGNTLYAAGVSPGLANYIQQWDGSRWSALGSGFDYSVYALAVSGTTLYAGGGFSRAGGVAANWIAQWDGSSWSALASGFDRVVRALAVSGNTLYAGGGFTTAGGVAANAIAQWDGSSWSALGSGFDGFVAALAISGNTLYAGGFIRTASGVQVHGIAQWDGSSWSALGSGFDGFVAALAISGNTLYAGGEFTTAGGVSASCIAAWDGSSWSALGSGMGGGSDNYGDYVQPSVSALAVSGNILYVGGDFTTAGGVAATNIARWDGSSWSALGSGMGGGSDNYGDYVQPSVCALAVSGNTLFAGGSFLTASGVAATNIAQWDGSSWSPLGSGVPNRLGYISDVSALAVSGNTLYIGGDFTMAGSVPANGFAQWDGNTWSAAGGGVIFAPSALAVSGNTLYAAGGTASGVSGIAQWDGSSWSVLGSGMNGGVGAVTVACRFFYPGGVYALAVSGNSLYAGGYFTTAGGKVSVDVAEAILVWPEITSGPLPNPDGSMTLNLSTGPSSPSRLYSSTNLAAPVLWQPIYTNLTGGAWQFTDTNTTAFKRKFYRLSTP